MKKAKGLTTLSPHFVDPPQRSGLWQNDRINNVNDSVVRQYIGLDHPGVVHTHRAIGHLNIDRDYCDTNQPRSKFSPFDNLLHICLYCVYIVQVYLVKLLALNKRGRSIVRRQRFKITWSWL